MAVSGAFNSGHPIVKIDKLCPTCYGEQNKETLVDTNNFVISLLPASAPLADTYERYGDLVYDNV